MGKMSRLQWPWKSSARFDSAAARFQDDDDEGSMEETSALNPSNDYMVRKSGSRVWATISIVLVVLGSSLLTGMVGFYAGLGHQPGSSVAQRETYIDGLLAPPGDTPSHMIWNTTFAKLPTEKKQWAWGTLFPTVKADLDLSSANIVGEGHVRHPELAPDTSTLAVFHHLHCLQSIDYYIDRELIAQKERRQHDHSTTEAHGVYPVHIHHCFDLLRQALLCSADTNLEPLDTSLYGNHLAMPRKCRDINKVIEWAEKWQSPLVATGEVGDRLGVIRAASEIAYAHD